MKCLWECYCEYLVRELRESSTDGLGEQAHPGSHSQKGHLAPLERHIVCVREEEKHISLSMYTRPGPPKGYVYLIV